MGLIPESGRSPGGGNGNPLQYSCLENPMDRETWRATVPGVKKSRTRLKGLSRHTRRLKTGACLRSRHTQCLIDMETVHVLPSTFLSWFRGCCCVQPCPILCDPRDCSPPGSSICGIFQARILEWVAISSSRGPSQPRDRTLISSFSCIGRRILYH